MMESKPVVPLPHHVQQKLCHTRAPYRQGKKLTAVKVYTINDESQHLIVCGVPKLNLLRDLKNKFIPYGDLKKVCVIPDYPNEEFTETVHVHYNRIQSARIAKRFLDGFNFFGGVLHVFYAPELETFSETRKKLFQRQKDVGVRIQRHKNDPTNPEIDPFVPDGMVHRKKKHPALPVPEEYLHTESDMISSNAEFTEHQITANVMAPESSGSGNGGLYTVPPAPYSPNEAILQSGVSKRPKMHKIKNYKGRTIKVRDTTAVISKDKANTSNALIIPKETETKNVFSAVKKAKNEIKIIIPSLEKQKKIVINDPSVSKLV